jgi:peroxiredoxin
MMKAPVLSTILEQAVIRCRDLEAPLADRLQAFANEVRQLGPEFTTAVDRVVNRLVTNGAGATAPKIGEPMPAFLLPDDQGQLVRLDDLLRDGPVAIVFHRGHWCPYCRINIDALARVEDAVSPQHRHVAAIVPDRQKFSKWLKSDGKASFPVLSDIDNGYAMCLGLAIGVGDEMAELMLKSGWDPAISQGSDTWLLPIPATFIVGTDGIVHARFVDPDYRVRMATEDMVAALLSAD